MNTITDVNAQIEEQIRSHEILLYMKGSPKLPQCGFSSRVCQILSKCGIQFAFVDILANPHIRAQLPKYANWPTFPQLWINGELVGGCDIMEEMYQNGELIKLLKTTTQNQPTDNLH